MSRGPGRIERAVEAILAAEPDNAFTIEDLCERVYRGISRVEKKHRVAVRRAAEALLLRCDTLARTRATKLCAYYNAMSVLAYAMAKLKVDWLHDYPWRYTEDDLREVLARKYHHYVEPGGAWWEHTQSRIAEIEATRAGDTKRIEEIRAERKARQEAALGEISKDLGKAMGRLTGQSVTCSFCGKTEHEVQAIVTGGQAAICSECIAVASQRATEHTQQAQKS